VRVGWAFTILGGLTIVIGQHMDALVWGGFMIVAGLLMLRLKGV
jgi:hypothetical protein